MSTLDGIGTRFNGVSQPDEQGHVHATYWFTFLYLPLIPLWRAEIKRDIALPLKTFSYQVIQKLPLDKNEIFKTYLYGWIFIPFPHWLVTSHLAVVVPFRPTTHCCRMIK